MTNRELLMGIDIGSTAVKVIVMTAGGDIRASSSSHYATSSPRPGWVEQDPEAWWTAVVEATRTCLRMVDKKDIAAVSFSGHMSAPILLGNDGSVLLPSIMIADTRSVEQTNMLREGYVQRIRAMTGNEPLDAFAVSKLLWIQKHHPEKWDQAKAIVFPKDFIRYRFTGRLGTDPTDAGNSLLYNYKEGAWADDLMLELGLDPALFPSIYDSHSLAGQVSREAAMSTGLPEGTPIVTGGADMACSQLGAGAVSEGTLAVTLSTSAQVVMRVTAPFENGAGGVTFHPSAVKGSLYAMGSIFTGGLGVDWGFRLLTGKERLTVEDFGKLAALTEKMELLPPGSEGLLFLPFLTGSGTPHFDPRDRASWLGLSVGQDPALLLHSVMEGVAYNVRETMEVFEAEGCKISRVHVGGGGSKNPVWCRMIADVLGRNVNVLANRDASAMGAAFLAGVGSGIYSSVEAADFIVRTGDVLPFSPSRNEAYNGIYRRYRKVYGALNEYYRNEVIPIK